MAITASVCEASILRIIMVLRGNSDKCGLIVCGGKGARAPRTVEFYRIIVQMKKPRPEEEQHTGKCVHGLDPDLPV